jgi:hypothetical protein
MKPYCTRAVTAIWKFRVGTLVYGFYHSSLLSRACGPRRCLSIGLRSLAPRHKLWPKLADVIASHVIDV